LFEKKQYRKGKEMALDKPKDGMPGTTTQSPRWEGPQENTPHGYMRAKDNPDKDRDALGESNSDPEAKHLSDAMKTTGDK
jgi:hypothetical protein